LSDPALRSSTPPWQEVHHDAELHDLARFGPTTPTRARRSLAASVDPTDARNEILGCFGRSDRRAQDDRPTLRSI
jgi:hypothetical protein